jgi:hypothetical protein
MTQQETRALELELLVFGLGTIRLMAFATTRIDSEEVEKPSIQEGTPTAWALVPQRDRTRHDEDASKQQPQDPPSLIRVVDPSYSLLLNDLAVACSGQSIPNASPFPLFGSCCFLPVL